MKSYEVLESDLDNLEQSAWRSTFWSSIFFLTLGALLSAMMAIPDEKAGAVRIGIFAAVVLVTLLGTVVAFIVWHYELLAKIKTDRDGEAGVGALPPGELGISGSLREYLQLDEVDMSAVRPRAGAKRTTRKRR